MDFQKTCPSWGRDKKAERTDRMTDVQGRFYFIFNKLLK